MGAGSGITIMKILTKFAQRYLAARRASGYESENRWGTEKKGDARTIWV